MRKVELGYLTISEQAKKNVVECLTNNRLSAGKYIRRFEQEFAAAHGCRHAIFCNSGTSALQIALAALKEANGWKDGDEVIVPAVTFVASSNTVLQNQLQPVFVDVDPATYNLNPSLIEPVITSKTRLILPVHLFGQPCDMEPILEIAGRRNLKVLEDSCETMFARYAGRWVGSFGDAACFSTYVAHLLVTGVGGFVTTQSESLATLARSIMAHGRDAIYLTIDDDDNLQDKEKLRRIIERRFSFIRMGYSYRATEMEAALGVAALEGKDEMIAKRRANAAVLLTILKPLEEHLKLPVTHPRAEHSFMMFPVVVKNGLDREPLVSYLEEHGIETRYMMPLLNQPFYQELFGRDRQRRYPVAADINAHGFYIGCHQGLTQEDLDYVGNVFTSYFQRITAKVRP